MLLFILFGNNCFQVPVGFNLWTLTMTKLGKFLKQLRKNAGFSIRDVEGMVKEIHPQDSKYQVSHTYLRKLENGAYLSPNPFKLKALCSVLGANYEQVLYLADYLDEREVNTEFQELCDKMVKHLEAEDINPVYFVQALLDLGPTSLSLINRTLSMLVVQERSIHKKHIEATESKTPRT